MLNCRKQWGVSNSNTFAYTYIYNIKIFSTQSVVVVVMIIHFISILQVAAVFMEQENEMISIKDVIYIY